jgi:hypothetical protein
MIEYEGQDEWAIALYAVTSLRHSNIGFLGHYYCGMMDVYTTSGYVIRIWHACGNYRNVRVEGS